MEKKIIFALSCLISLDVQAQNNAIIPPSPVSTEYAKYTTHEVSLYNGIPEISIPLYTIQLKGLIIPISLSYHASGIKFGQDDGEVGVGWSLNPGYRISRSIYGYADELSPMPSDISTIMDDFEYEVGLGYSQAKMERDQYLWGFVPGLQYNYNGPTDGEYDQFVFSTPTANGEFIISDRVNKTVVTLQSTNLKINYLAPTAESIIGFQVIDDLGNKYSFGDYDYQNVNSKEHTSEYYGRYAFTAWGLSKIKTVVGEEIEFQYNQGSPNSNYLYNVRSFTVGEADPSNCMISTYSSAPEGDIYFPQGYNTFFNSKILTPNEIVLFNFQAFAPEGNKLRNIYVKSLEGDTIKTIDFFYSTNQFHVFLDSVTISGRNSVGFETFRFDYFSKDISTALTADHYGFYLNSYNLQYFHQEFLDDPVWTSTQDDINCSIGFGRQISEFMSGITVSREPNPNVAPDYFSLKRITYPTGGYTEYEYEPGSYSDAGYTYPVKKAGMRIKTIKSYDLGVNDPILLRYSYGIEEDGIGVSSFYVYNLESLFVKEIADYYNPSFLSSARRVISYSTTMQGDINPALNKYGLIRYPCVTVYCDYLTPSSSGKTTYFFNTGLLFDIGSLSTRNPVPFEHYLGTHYTKNYRTWEKPLLERKITYARSDGQYYPLLEEVFDYDRITLTNHTGLLVESAAVIPNGSNLYLEYYDNGIPGFFNYQEYNVTTGYNFLRSKEEYQYLNNRTIYSEYNYEYNNLLLSKETIDRSRGDDLVNYTSYPLDYDTTAISFIQDMARKNLLNYPIEKVSYVDNGVNQVVISGLITQYKTGGNGLIESIWSLENNSPIDRSSFKFSNRAIGILPLSGTAGVFSKDNRYKLSTTYDQYGPKGNILQLHKKEDTKISYLWGYNDTYPTVKAENSSYTDIAFTGFEDINYGGWTYQSGSRSTLYSRTGRYSCLNAIMQKTVSVNSIISLWLKTGGGTPSITGYTPKVFATTDGWIYYEWNVPPGSFTVYGTNCYIDDLRLYPVGAMMTTYTYDPLVGMTSATDPNGIITRYEYDSFGRLKNVRNNDGNITARNYYHYYNDTSSDTPYLNTSPTSMSFGSGASSSSLTITSNSSWSITDNASWLSVNTSSGTGNATVTVSVTANTSAARNATITITYAGSLTKTISVSQAAGSTSTLVVSPMTINFGSIAPPQTIAVTSNTSWTVTKSASWITISATSGTGNGTITVSGTKLLSGTRSGTVTFKTTDNTVTRIVNVYQDSGLQQ